jgi:hypothetical protein
MSASLLDLISDLQPFAQDLVDLAGRAGVQPRVTSTRRSHAQQQRLYRAFLAGHTKYPVAPPYTSAHEYGFAFDMVADTAENLHDLGYVWGTWGGLWSPHDEVHFEYPGFVASELAVNEPGFFETVQSFGDWYVNLPWYATLFLPTAATARSTKSPATTQIGHAASNLLCDAGFTSFC